MTKWQGKKKTKMSYNAQEETLKFVKAENASKMNKLSITETFNH